jgi:hypothetical protein
VTAARINGVSGLQKASALWRQRVEHDRADPEERLFERRGLYASPTFEGW